jgi:hypothetical protein
MNPERKTRRQKGPPPPLVDSSGPADRNDRARVAVEIMERARALREQAEHSDFGLIAYLLDMVIVEAQETGGTAGDEETED